MLGALTLRARSLAAFILVAIGSGAGVLPIHAGEVRYYETSAGPTQSTAMQKTILDTPTGTQGTLHRDHSHTETRRGRPSRGPG
jgi:hypothetical protein